MNLVKKNIIKHYSSILNILQKHNGIEKNLLKEAMDVSVPTVNKILGEMEEYNLVYQKNNCYWINENAFSLIGISIGSAQSKVLLLDATCKMMENEKALKFRKLLCEKLEAVIESEDPFFIDCKKGEGSYVFFSTPKDFISIKMYLDKIFECIKTVATEEREYGLNIFSIGISTTGLVNRRAQEIVEAHNATSIEHATTETLLYEDCKSFLMEKGINVHLEQNSKAAVIAEKMDMYIRNDIHKECENMATIYLGGGIGCGIISNNRVLYGRNGYTGEIGHLSARNVIPDEMLEKLPKKIEADKQCSCGKEDCFDHLIRKYVFGKCKREFSYMSSSEVAEFLENPDNKLQKNILIRYLGTMSEILCDILNLELIVFTGKLHFCKDSLAKGLDMERDRNSMRYIANDCSFTFSKLGASAPAVGAAIAAYYDGIGLEFV